MRLFAFLRPNQSLVDQVDQLSAKLAELEATELQRELRTVELHDQIKRMLARMDTHEQRRKQREEGSTDSAPDDVTRMLLRAKYPKQNGG